MTEGDVYQIETGGLQGQCTVTVLEAEKVSDRQLTFFKNHNDFQRPLINWKPKKIEAKAGEPVVVKVPFQVRANLINNSKNVGDRIDFCSRYSYFFAEKICSVMLR